MLLSCAQYFNQPIDRILLRLEWIVFKMMAPPHRLKIVVIGSLSSSLINFRLGLLKGLVRDGYEVVAMAPENDPKVVSILRTHGIGFIPILMRRAQLSPLRDLLTLASLYSHFRRLRPDLILPYTMKPIIFGNIAARMARVPRRFALVTGLGFLFVDPHAKGIARLVQLVVQGLYRMAFHRVESVFVYNATDAEFVRKAIPSKSRIVLVPGSGVDLAHFKFSAPPHGPTRFLLIARLLPDKGIFEFVEAARKLREKFPLTQFQLLGPFEVSSRNGILPDVVQSWVDSGVIEYLGETDDVRPYLAHCTVFVLPAYREGLPRSVLEAMATGRAIITTDAPGCRDTVEVGKNGFLVPPRDTAKLAEAMEALIVEPNLVIEMGKYSRDLAERYDVSAVTRIILNELSSEYSR